MPLLSSLSKRMENSPEFMAHVLTTYKRQEGLGDSQLLEALGTSSELLVRLALCRRPEANSPEFAEQVRLLSDFTLIDESLLAHIIRQVDGLNELSHHPFSVNLESNVATLRSTNSFLAAARDREDESTSEEEEDHPNGPLEENS
ncbi:MAG: hypothetical protein V7641_4232 [Blastocatellia bacterium]